MSVLRNRKFAILFFGLLVSVAGNNLFMIALPWYVYSTTGEKLDLALTGIFQALPGILGLFVGVFVDRWRKRQTMIWSNILRGLICLALYAIVFLDPPLMALLIPVVLLEIVGTFYSPAENALLPLILSEEELTSAMGFIKSGVALARLLGMLVGGILISLIGPQLLFLLDALTFGVSLLTLLFVRVSEVAQPISKKASFRHDWLEGIRTIIQFKVLLRIVIATVVTGGVLAPLDIIMTAWVKGPLNGTALVLGLINASIFVGVLVGGITLGRINKKFNLKTILVTGLIISGTCMSIMGIFANMYWTIALGLIMGFSMGVFNGSIATMVFKATPKKILGRIFSIVGSLSMLAFPLGMALYGWMMVYVPLQWLYAFVGIPTVFIGFSFLMPIKDETTYLQNKDRLTGSSS